MSALAERDVTAPAEGMSCIRVGRTEAVDTGDVRPQDMTRGLMEGTGRQASTSKGKNVASKQKSAAAVNRRTQLRSHASRMAAETALDEAEGADDSDGTSDARDGVENAVRAWRTISAKGRSNAAARPAAARRKGGGAAKEAKAGAVRQKAQAQARAHAEVRLRERAAATAAKEAARTGGSEAALAGGTSAAAPIAGVLAAVVLVVTLALAASQAMSALLGFWDNEAQAQTANNMGLPPYITSEMVEAALECQEEYGHPAGCTIAQIICESGAGDHLSGLATRDNNLFGIKWAPSFAAAPEVTGKDSWSTGEEYGGQHVTIMADFTRFRSMRDCIVFRSRVLLQNQRYAGNPLIQQAIAEHDSDKMAEGLKDAGYATDSAYVGTLKSIMATYGLYRLDGMTVEGWRNGSAGGGAVVEAAYSQLGVPYVWGGTSPGHALDCSGLTQYCYAQAGISIPRNSEAQANAGTKVPLSEARTGDILWRPGHVAIYIGSDQYIHEPRTGDVCRIGTGISYFTCAVRF